MFEFLKRNKKVELFSPVVGKSICLEKVPDKVFANRLLGDGIAFEIAGDTLYAPCDAKVVMVASTNHAIGLKTGRNIEILFHVGLDTVELKGEGLETLVVIEEKVKRGQPLLKINKVLMKEKRIDLTTSMVITSQNHQLKISEPDKVDLNSLVISIE